MTRMRKFWILFLSFLPLSAAAMAPLAIGLIGGGIAIAGFSIYRSMSPVNMADAFSFFSSCWSCGMFNEIMLLMSNILPGIYSAIGKVCIPIAFVLTAVYFAWEIVRPHLGLEKYYDPWSLSGKFAGHLVRLVLIVGLFAIPLPRLITNVAIEPIFNVGLSMAHSVDKEFTKGTDSEFSFESCLVASAVMDPSASDAHAANSGAFSPRLRHNMACQLGQIHQVTGLGMTAGWTMLNMAFNEEYMHKIIFGIPIFPNIPVFLAGLLILAVFFLALLPIPLYFLETFITLALDLVMLPLLLLSWLFKDWKVLNLEKPKNIIDRVVQNTVGIAMVGIFATFAVLFLNSAFGKLNGIDVLKAALADEKNGAYTLMNGLMMNNDSLITVVLMGLFLAMIMNSIPALVKALFGNIEIPTKYYDSAKKNINTLWTNTKKYWTSTKTAIQGKEVK